MCGRRFKSISCGVAYLLWDLKLLDHTDLVVHLDATLYQLHLGAVEIGEAELVDLKLLNKWRQVFFLYVIILRQCGFYFGALNYCQDLSLTRICKSSSSSHSLGSQPKTSLVFCDETKC